jgi:hypothetical protein
MRFDILNAAKIRMLFFWVACFQMKMGTACFRDSQVPTYEPEQRHNPEEQHRHLHRRGNLRPHSIQPIVSECTHQYKAFCLTGTEYASLASDGVSLQSREHLDRDTGPDGSGTSGPGSELRVHVTCTVNKGRSINEVGMTVRITVLDEDDNPPVAQMDEHILSGIILEEVRAI